MSDKIPKAASYPAQNYNAERGKVIEDTVGAVKDVVGDITNQLAISIEAIQRQQQQNVRRLSDSVANQLLLAMVTARESVNSISQSVEQQISSQLSQASQYAAIGPPKTLTSPSLSGQVKSRYYVAYNTQTNIIQVTATDNPVTIGPLVLGSITYYGPFLLWSDVLATVEQIVPGCVPDTANSKIFITLEKNDELGGTRLVWQCIKPFGPIGTPSVPVMTIPSQQPIGITIPPVTVPQQITRPVPKPPIPDITPPPCQPQIPQVTCNCPKCDAVVHVDITPQLINEIQNILNITQQKPPSITVLPAPVTVVVEGEKPIREMPLSNRATLFSDGSWSLEVDPSALPDWQQIFAPVISENEDDWDDVSGSDIDITESVDPLMAGWYDSINGLAVK